MTPTSMWFIFALSIVALAVGLLRTRRSGPPDLGYVSERWLAEHRAYEPGASR